MENEIASADKEERRKGKGGSRSAWKKPVASSSPSVSPVAGDGRRPEEVSVGGEAGGGIVTPPQKTTINKRMRGGGERKAILRGGGGRGRIGRGGRRPPPPIERGGGGVVDVKIGYLEVVEGLHEGNSGARILLGTRCSPRFLAFKETVGKGVASDVSPFDKEEVEDDAKDEGSQLMEVPEGMVIKANGWIEEDSVLKGVLEEATRRKEVYLVSLAVEEDDRRQEMANIERSSLWKDNRALIAAINGKNDLIEGIPGGEANVVVSLEGEGNISDISNQKDYSFPIMASLSSVDNYYYLKEKLSKDTLRCAVKEGSELLAGSKEDYSLTEIHQEEGGDMDKVCNSFPRADGGSIEKEVGISFMAMEVAKDSSSLDGEVGLLSSMENKEGGKKEMLGSLAKIH